MIRTIEAVIDENGRIQLLESVSLSSSRRALVTILEEEPLTTIAETAGLSEHAETAGLSEQALAEDWNRPEEDEAWIHLQQAKSF